MGSEDVELKEFQLPFHHKHEGSQAPALLGTRQNSIVFKQQHQLQGSIYETYDPLREKWSYAIAVQAFLVYLIYLYYERICNVHRLLGCVLMGGQTACMAQSINQLYKRQYDLNKHIKFFVWGVINGVLTMFWIELLLKVSAKTVVRVSLDQGIGNPGFQLLFVTFDSMWDRANLIERLKKTYIPTCKISFLFWPFVSIVSFGLMRQDLIFPFNCFLSLVWSVVLAVIT
ncbi:unnamed protein product [Kuraishia capsulata CBS 1993]|uniref:Protein sym1 n=1 Tax=Kuraishia capsulata CBS 1993 TaxID=1382522 RepID=W6MXH9_9ASCO|nr:uncharacterized protein KUCA_T00004905001 [Kuraishia capsulata CBS 1993]CDK28920.1 unnamed protein product [Kuraishia capsulata CBS 1993]